MKYPSSGEVQFHYRDQSIRFGDDVLSFLARDLNYGGSSPAKKIIIVGGHNSLNGSGVLRDLNCALGGFDKRIVDRIPPSPEKESVNALAGILNQYQPDYIVAAGGGSVLDTSKIAKLWSSSKAPIVAVPTTAGTGAETTPFATLWDQAKGIKTSVEDKSLLPALVYVDPKFTRTMPLVQTVSTGIDSLSHALESLWSNGRTRDSIPFALGSAQSTLGILDELTSAAPSKEARRKQSWAALQAGFAIGISKTALAHAISYGFTLFHKVPHGLAIGLVLSEVTRHNWRALSSDQQNSILASARQDNVEELADRIFQFARSADFCVPKPDTWKKNAILAQAFENPRLQNNLVAPTKVQIAALLDRCALRWETVRA